MEENSLDCRGLKCPMPVTIISLAMKGLGVGQRLRVQATDSAFRADRLEELSRGPSHRGITAGVKVRYLNHVPQITSTVA
jgi:TusA-related sulfurtransferase